MAANGGRLVRASRSEGREDLAHEACVHLAHTELVRQRLGQANARVERREAHQLQQWLRLERRRVVFGGLPHHNLGRPREAARSIGDASVRLEQLAGGRGEGHEEVGDLRAERHALQQTREHVDALVCEHRARVHPHVRRVRSLCRGEAGAWPGVRGGLRCRSRHALHKGLRRRQE
eukprot:6388923-Prymnesium_polylepis.1